MTNKEIVWQLTDCDNQQYGRAISNTIFEFKEFDYHNYNLVDELEKLGENIFYDTYFPYTQFWVIQEINLKNYSIEEQKQHCSAYYPENEFKDLENWIIAECIFEQENGLY